MERPTCAVALIFQYECSGGEKRTDKGGKATLFKRGNRLFLLTVKQVATYSDIRPNTEKLLSVTIPFLRAVRGEKKLTYKNVLKDEPIPNWTPVDVSDEDPKIPVGEDKFLNLETHDSIYWIEVTKEAWAASPLYKPPQETTVNISLGESVRFGSQRRMGTGFLSEFPQWRSIREVEGKSTHYPGEGNSWYSVNSPFQVPPTNIPDCKGASISFALPSSILTDWCYYPPMFLLDVNIKNAAVGWPVLNEQNELVGLISQPMYVMDTKDICFPGTWVCAVPAGLEFPSNEQPAAEESAETPAEGEAGDQDATSQKKPKKANKAKKKKGKGKRK